MNISTKRLYFFGLMMLTLASNFVFGQTGVINVNDPIVIYNAASPPATPAANTMAKWVKTNRVSFTTTSYKCYYYNGVAFRLKFPKSYQQGVSDGKKYPLYLFFHGIGEKGTIYDNEYQLYHGGDVHAAAVDAGTFDGFLLYPQSSASSGFFGNAQYEALYNVITKYLVPECKVDPSRIIVDGLSGGGTATWGFSMKYPKLVSCLTPISSAVADFNNGIPTLKFKPVWLHQGGKDTGPTPATASVVVSAYNAAGAQFTYTLYTTLGHSCWDSAWKEPDYYPYMNRAHMANPWILGGRTQYCPGDTINATIGMTPGFDSYQWRKDGNVITGATSNTITATAAGVYDCRYLDGTTWSDWSPRPDTIKIKTPTVSPNITISGLMSDVIPAPDGNTSVTLMVPTGYASYSWSKVDSSTVLSTTNTLKATAPGQYHVQVMELYGCSSNYSTAFTVINADGPNKPDPATSLKATTLSKTSVELDWSSNPNPAFNETNFEIYLATKAGGPYRLAALAAADASTYTLNGLNSGTPYYFIVRAINNTGAAVVSNEALASTQSDVTAPTAPTNLKATTTSTSSVTLSWTNSTDDVGVTGYDVYVNGVKTYTTLANPFTVYNLTHGRSYTFYVQAKDYANNLSQPSNQVNAEALASGLSYKYFTYTGSTWAAMPNYNTLVPVSTGFTNNVIITGTTQSTLFSYLWEGVITVPTTGTYTFRTNSDDGSRVWLGALGATASPYSYGTASLINSDGAHGTKNVDSTITLTAGIYPIAIAYYQGTGGSAMNLYWKLPSGTAFVKIPDSAFVEKTIVNGTAPAIPSNLKAVSAGYNKINLTWNDNSNNEQGFEIFRSTNNLTGFVNIARVGANVTSFSDSNSLNALSTYYYKVRAIGQYGASVLTPNDNLSAKWLFNGNVNDSSGNGILLTATNSPTYDATDVKEGSSSLVLNGTNQYATISTTGYLLNGLSQLTVSFWMKSAVNTGSRVIFDLGGNDNGLALRVDASKLYAGVASGSNRVNISVAYTSTAWNHITLVYSGSSLLLYVNGVLAASNTALPFTSIGVTTNASRIGTNNSNNAFNTGTGFFSGKLDNFSIYNTALSVTDIAAVMANTYGYVSATTGAMPTVPADPTGLVATGASAGKVIITWNDNAVNETSYQLYRSTTTNSSYSLLTTLPANTTSYTDTVVYANSIYYYKVRAAGVGGYSNYSVEDSALTGNHNPVLSKAYASPLYMRYDGTLQVPVVATDADVENLTVTVNNLPAFATYTSTGNGTGTINFAPTDQSQVGTYSGITVVVTDQHGGSTSASFDLIVNNNYIPTVTGASNVTLKEKTTAVVTLIAADQNATDVLTWSITGVPGFATKTVSGDTVTFALAPGYSDNGTYTVKAVVNDGNNGIDTVSFTITVQDVNPSKSIYVNFTDGTYTAGTPWNNTSKVPALNDNFATLKDSTGVATTVGVKLTTLWTGINNAGVNTGNNSGVYPDAVLRSSYYTGTTQTVKIYGLDPTTTYNFTMTGSRANPAAGIGVAGTYTIGGVAQTLDATNNSTKVVSFTGIKAAADSSVTLTVAKATGSTYAYLNALVIQSVYNDSTAPAKPRDIAAVLQGSKVALTWTDAAYNETGYDVFRATSLAGPYTQLVTAGTNANLTSYTDTAIHGATTYYYSVRAVNSYGATYSDTVSVTSPNVPPVLASIADIKIKTDSVVDLAITATDDSTDIISLSASGLPSFASFTDNGGGHGVLHIAPGSTTGIFKGVAITAKDNHDSATTRQFTISVSDKNLTLTYVNVNQSLPASSPWNNTSAIPVAGITTSNLKDADGNNTGMSLSFTEGWTGYNTNGQTTGNNSGVYPDTVMQTFYYDGSGNTKHVVLSGLSLNKRYNLIFFASRQTYTQSLVTNYNVGSTTVSLDANGNVSNTVQINGITPDTAGKITINITKATSSPNAYLGALVIQSYNYNGVPAAPATPAAIGTGKTKITFSWTKASDSVTSYEVWRSGTYSGTYSQIGTVGGSVYSYIDSGLVQGATWFYKVRSLTSGVYSGYSTVAGASTVAFTINLNLNDGSANAPAQAGPWNNTNTLIDAGYQLSNMQNDQYQGTGVNFGVTQAFSGFNTVGSTTGNNSGIVPDNVMKNFYYCNYADTAILKISGLNSAYVYNLSFFGSRANPTVSTVSAYITSGKTVTLDANNNVSNVATIYALKPDSTGSISFSVTALNKGGFGYLGAMFIDGVLKADTAADGSTVVLGGRNTGRGTVTVDNSANVIDSVITGGEASAYPNPFVDDVTLKLQLAQPVSKFLVSMIDMNGRIVYRKEFYNAQAGTWQQALGVPGSTLSKGVYLIQVSGIGTEKPRTFKLIKK